MVSVLVCLSVLSILSASTVASGIGFVPNKLAIGPGEKRLVWLANPNSHEINAFVESDCADVVVKNDNVRLKAYETMDIMVQAKSKTDGCQGSIMVGIVEQANGALGVLPSVSIPLSLASNTKTYEVYRTIPSWDSKPKPSKTKGFSITAGIVGLGLAFYFVRNGHLRRVCKMFRFSS